MTQELLALSKSVNLALATAEKILSPPPGIMTTLKYLGDAKQRLEKIIDDHVAGRCNM